jgi:hypothetical protein
MKRFELQNVKDAVNTLRLTATRRRVGLYEGVPRSFRTGRLEWELQIVQLPATSCCFIAILWVNLVRSATITLCVASQRVFIVLCFVMTQSGNFWIHPRIVCDFITGWRWAVSLKLSSLFPGGKSRYRVGGFCSFFFVTGVLLVGRL